jgi:hypothetical protein
MTLTRRTFLKSAAAAGALAMTRPWGALAETLGPVGSVSTSRSSRLFSGVQLVHADMHNHTLLSDGDGDPAKAFGSMRDAGLDVAALTDHSTIQWGTDVDPCGDLCTGDAAALAGINEEKWAEMARLADLANADGSFIALRGFEWSSPFQGHMNVWFSERWIDPLHTGGGSVGEGYLGYAHAKGLPMSPQVIKAYDAAVKALPTSGATMLPFYQWLKTAPDTPVLGGGSDGLASFNHPGREPGRFGYFKLKKNLRPQVVAMEVFNRRDEYFFEGTEGGQQSPLNECLNAGWKVGLSGVTDEHGTDWGFQTGKGRTGLWVSQWSRAGIRQALQVRRFFATREPGVRIDAAAKRAPMGSTIQHTSGWMGFLLDIDGPGWAGRDLNVQILRPGTSMPTVIANVPVTVPAESEPVLAFGADVDLTDGSWVVLRISDPSLAADDRAKPYWRSFGRALAYTSPWFLQA